MRRGPNDSITSMSLPAKESAALSRAALASVFILALSLSAFKAKDLDIPWHLKTGEWIVAHHAVPRADFFSYSREGQEWIDAQWLFQVACYTDYSLLGATGISLLTMLMTVSIAALLALSVTGVPLGLRSLLLALLLIGLNPRIVCRPEYLTCVYMAAMFLVLERAAAGRTKYLWLAPAIQLLWANSEGLWPIGPAIIAVVVLDLVLQNAKRPGFSWKRPAPAPWLYMAGASVLCCLMQPYFIKGFLFPLTLLKEVLPAGAAQKEFVAEFQPLFGRPTVWPSAVPFLVFAGLMIAVTLAAGRRVRVFLLLFGLFFLFLAFSARRNVSIAGVVLAYMGLVHLRVLAEGRVRSWARGAAALGLIVSLAGSVLAQASAVREWDGTGKERGLGFSDLYYPAGAAEFLHSVGYHGNILNNDRVGGYLIWAGWPGWKVFADPRMEIGGEKAIRERMYVFINRGAFIDATRPYDVQAIVIDLWEPTLVNFAAMVDQMPDWALVYLDHGRRFAVFLKRTAAWNQAIAAHEVQH
jgi:hypothetical protein